MWGGSCHGPQAQALQWREGQPAGAAAVWLAPRPPEPPPALSRVRPTGQPAQPTLRSCLQLLGQAGQLPPEGGPPTATSCVLCQPEARLPARWGDGPSRGRRGGSRSQDALPLGRTGPGAIPVRSNSGPLGGGQPRNWGHSEHRSVSEEAKGFPRRQDGSLGLQGSLECHLLPPPETRTLPAACRPQAPAAPRCRGSAPRPGAVAAPRDHG